MGITPWQSVCLVLLGAILAVWIDDGSTTTEPILECTPTRPSLMMDPSIATENLQQSTDQIEKNTDKTVGSLNTQIAEEAALRWNQNVLQSKGQSLNYLRDPKAFVDRFEECAVDPQCHIMLHHVSKTGGKLLRIYPAFSARLSRVDLLKKVCLLTDLHRNNVGTSFVSSVWTGSNAHLLSSTIKTAVL